MEDAFFTNIHDVSTQDVSCVHVGSKPVRHTAEVHGKHVLRVCVCCVCLLCVWSVCVLWVIGGVGGGGMQTKVLLVKFPRKAHLKSERSVSEMESRILMRFISDHLKV